MVDEVEVGFLPDALLFAPDGATAVVANEGEPSDDYLIDPPGTISVIDLDTFEVAEVGFAELGVDDVVNSESFRSFGPNAGNLAVDIEPENIAFDADSTTAWVTLQENNAIAEIDLVDGELVEVFALLLVTANEGDARDYDGYSEEERLGDVRLCEGFAYDGMDAAALKLDEPGTSQHHDGEGVQRQQRRERARMPSTAAATTRALNPRVFPSARPMAARSASVARETRRRGRRTVWSTGCWRRELLKSTLPVFPRSPTSRPRSADA